MRHEVVEDIPALIQ